VVGYPIFTALIILASDLIEVLFGSRWLPAVPAFQILCCAGTLKLLNTYASSATQAKGVIWSEVSRQVVSTVLLVVSVAVLARWGIAGAAAGVLAATTATTILMHDLVRRQTGLRWREIVQPQVPAIVCSAGLALMMSLTGFVLQRYGNTPAPWKTLLVTGILGGIYYLAFLLFSGFREVRELVFETLDDLAPFAARRIRTLTGENLPAVAGR
jgi:O-antigen/teichoic acid export membrane protein